MGVNKIVAILAAIATQKVVLIDELENGIHYKKLPQLWFALNESAKTYGSQIFASTHSKECLGALLPAMADDENDFALPRSNLAPASDGRKISLQINFCTLVKDIESYPYGHLEGTGCHLHQS